MWSATNKPLCQGFTLLEIVISLVIAGFMAASIGSGLVYSVQLYRTAQQTDTAMPQIDAAVNIIRRVVQQESSFQDITTKRFSCKDGQLFLDSYLLLNNVEKFDVTEPAAFEALSAGIKVRHVLLRFNFDGNLRTIEFDVCPQ